MSFSAWCLLFVGLLVVSLRIGPWLVLVIAWRAFFFVHRAGRLVPRVKGSTFSLEKLSK